MRLFDIYVQCGYCIDFRIYLLLFAFEAFPFSLFAVVAAVATVAVSAVFAVEFWFFWDISDVGFVLVMLTWTFFSLFYFWFWNCVYFYGLFTDNRTMSLPLFYCLWNTLSTLCFLKLGNEKETQFTKIIRNISALRGT